MRDIKVTFSLGALLVLLLCATIIGPGSQVRLPDSQYRHTPTRVLRTDFDQRIERFPEPEMPITAPGSTPLDERKEGLIQRIRAARQPQTNCQVVQPQSVVVSSQPIPMATTMSSGEPTPAPPLEGVISQGVVSQGVTGTPCLPCDAQQNRMPPAFVPHVPYYSTNYPQPQLIGDLFTRPTSKKYKLAIFVDQAPRSVTVLNWFSSHERLRTLKASSDVQVYSPNDTLYITRHQQLVPPSTFPAVVLMDQQGGMIYQGGGRDLPASPDVMWSDMCKSKQNYDSIQSGRINRYLTQQQLLQYQTTTSPVSSQYDPLPRYAQSDYEDPPCIGPDCNRPRPLRPSPDDPTDVPQPDVWPVNGPVSRLLEINYETLVALVLIVGAIGLVLYHLKQTKP